MTLDSHQHFWRYDAAQYAWIDASMAALRRDFLPVHLAPSLEAAGIGGTIAVQARQSVEDTEWLLQLAAQWPTVIKGVVGWVPLRQCGKNVGAVLERWSASAALKGVRHVLQAEPDDYFADPAFHAAVAQLAAHGLTYDLLIRAAQLPAAITFVDRHPNLAIVLDHAAKPVVQGPPDPAWSQGIRQLARRENVFCKCSGLVTEAPGWTWSPAQLRPYLDIVLEAFGPHRVMFGSDWPVCLVAASYHDWHDAVRAELARLSRDEQAGVFGGTAARFYRLTAP